MDIDSDTADLTLVDSPAIDGFDTIDVGDTVYVDEGDNFGCKEYEGIVEAITERGEFKVRTTAGELRTAQRHQLDAL